jgi:uncharacterized protein
MGKSRILDGKFLDLLALLRKWESAVLAFSGGVDSSFLLAAMKKADMRILAVTAISETMPRKDRDNCASFIRELGVDHRFIQTSELSNESFVSNTPERCFFCKDELFRKLRVIAEEDGFHYVFDGSNSDDLEDYRPGRRAASIHGVRSPLAEQGLSKDKIRALSRELGLKTWDRPSSPCLSSRIPYGRRITAEALARVERAEEFIISLGVHEVRVRDYGNSARIEVNEENMPLLLDPANRRLVTDRLRSLGYAFVSMDLEGYRSGNMNKVLEDRNGTKIRN